MAALLGAGRLISTATAMTTVRTVELPCAAFRTLCRRRPDIGMQVYRAVADILGGRYQKTLTRLMTTLEQPLREELTANV